MAKLKPCPFCGSDDVVIKRDDSCGYTVICFKCNAKSDRCLSQKLAVEAWNRRVEITNNNFNDTKYYLQKKGEMCFSIGCDECPLGEKNNIIGVLCSNFEKDYPEEAIATVREWYEGHTEKFTYKDDFFSKFPDARRDTEGNPVDRITSKIIPACSIYPEILNRVAECSDCGICWDMEMEER